jgi:hypothetical protein
MAKTRISEFSSNPSNNTDIDGINIAEGMAPGLVNNAFRELMAQLKDFQLGSAGDPLTVGGNLAVTGTSVLTGNVTITGTATVSGRAVDAFPSGTKILFQQTTAPTGWTKDTTHDNKALRIVSGTAGSGGSINFTTAFGSQNVGDTALDATQIPSHNHTFSGTTSGQSVDHSHSGTTSTAGSHQHSIPTSNTGDSSGRADVGAGAPEGSLFTDAAGNHNHTFTTGGVSSNHTHTYSGTTSSVGSGATHTHTLNLAVSYVDVIICTKT